MKVSSGKPYEQDSMCLDQIANHMLSQNELIKMSVMINIPYLVIFAQGLAVILRDFCPSTSNYTYSSVNLNLRRTQIIHLLKWKCRRMPKRSQWKTIEFHCVGFSADLDCVHRSSFPEASCCPMNSCSFPVDAVVGCVGVYGYPVLLISLLHCLLVFTNSDLQCSLGLPNVYLRAVLARNLVDHFLLLLFRHLLLHSHKLLLHCTLGLEDSFDSKGSTRSSHSSHWDLTHRGGGEFSGSSSSVSRVCCLRGLVRVFLTSLSGNPLASNTLARCSISGCLLVLSQMRRALSRIPTCAPRMKRICARCPLEDTLR